MNFQTIYELIIESNALNFAILVYILVSVFQKFDLGKKVDDLREEINNNIKTSYSKAEDALLKFEKSKQRTKKVPFKKRAIINQANELIKKNNDKCNQEISKKESEIQADLIKAKNALCETVKTKILQKMQEAIYLSAIDTIKNTMNDDLHKKIIFDSINELESAKLGEIYD